MSKKRIYQLYAPGGNGHKSAAGMIEETFRRRYPDHEVITDNVRDLNKNPLVDQFMMGYDKILKVDPKYVKYGYNLLTAIKSEKSLVKLFPKSVDLLVKRLEEVKPDVIVSLHSAINYFLAAAIEKLGWKNKVPFLIVCTDMTDKFLNTWVNKEADLMVGFLEVTRKQFIEYNYPPEKITILGGPPVNPKFMDNTVSKKAARKMFGLDEDTFTVFIMSGGVGLKSIHRYAKQLANSSLPVQMILCCGRNEGLKAKCEKLALKSNKNIKVFGFSKQIDNMMDAADVIVAKPGPGVIAEAIVKELPIILDNLNEIMPQEAGNVNYVLENNVGFKVTEVSKFHNMIASLIYNDDIMPRMRGNMKRLRKGESSSRLADIIVSVATNGVTNDVFYPKLTQEEYILAEQ